MLCGSFLPPTKNMPVGALAPRCVMMSCNGLDSHPGCMPTVSETGSGSFMTVTKTFLKMNEFQVN